jgi:hypothetical protein
MKRKKKCTIDLELPKNNKSILNPYKSIINPNTNSITFKTINADENINEKNIPECQYCKKIFYHNANLNKHIRNNCKIKKQQDDKKEIIFKELLEKDKIIKEQQEKFNILYEQNLKLLKKINKITKVQNKSTVGKTTNINNNCNNTNSNNTNYVIQLVNFGNEDLKKIDNKDFFEKIVKNNRIQGVKIPEEILKLIHFNPKHPELNNIYISDINREKCMIFQDNMWKLSIDDKIPEVINKIVKYSYDKQDELKTEYKDNKSVINRLDVIDKYTKMNDEEYLQNLKDDQEENVAPCTNEIKRCEDFQKKTQETIKISLYNNGKKIKNKISNK